MDTFQVGTGKTTNSENDHKIVKIPKNPSKYVFKPEVVKPLPKHGNQGTNCERNLSRSLHVRQDGLPRGLKGFFSKSKNSEDKSQDFNSGRKRSRSLFDSQDLCSTKDGGRWFKPRGEQCCCKRCDKVEDLREKRKSSHNSKRQRDIERFKNPEVQGKCEKNGERCYSTDRTVHEKIYHDRIFQDRTLGSSNFEALDEKQHLARDFIRSQKDPELAEERDKNVNTFPSSGSSFPNHVLPSLARDQSKKKFAAKSLQESLKNPGRCEGCGEYHLPDKYVNFQMEYFVDGQVQDKDKEDEKKKFDRGEEAAVTGPGLLYKSRSLPQLSVHDSGVGSGNEQVPGRPSSRLVADLRQLLTLKQHYYPEGGWGWVIIVVGVLVQILAHGMHGAVGTLLLQAATRFGPPIYLQADGDRQFPKDVSRSQKMKMHPERRNDLQNPVCEDSGVASGELGEPSCSVDCDGACVIQNGPKKESEEHHDPRYIAQCTIRQHYYPESGWGWVVVVTGVMVQILSAGIHGAAGVWLVEGMKKYRQSLINIGWLGAMSTGVALLVSPVTIAFCRRKSTRLTAVLGGLVTALGCLFTSFATQFHQLFFSYGTVVGVGVGITRDCSTLMVAQYFKRRREFVEIFIVSGSGLGIAIMSAFIKGAISKIGWRLGLQAVTGVVFLTFILGTFYRSASLYHPQRRAILHLKNQKRKIKDKNKTDERPPFFDFSTLKSKTVRILLVSTGISAFGINTPIFYLAHQAEEEGLGDTVILLQTYLGLAWTLGCVTFGLLVVHHNVECRIARQYLTQAAVFMCGLCILALTTVHGNYHGYVMFTWIYGIFCGGYHYSLKMYTYERVRARNFAKTWGFVQCSQAIPIAIGVPISGYINVGCGGKAGYYFSSTCVLVGSFTLFFIDLHRRNLSRHKHTRENGTKHLCVNDTCPQRKRLSFSQEPENEGVAAGTAAAALVLGAELAPAPGELIDALGVEKPELTCISEEGIADMDLPDNILDDLDYIGDCITSCNKVENYLMLSEFENNLIAEMPIIMDRKGRRWSLAKSKGPLAGSQSGGQPSQAVPEEEEAKPKWRLMSAPPSSREITVIDEAST